MKDKKIYLGVGIVFLLILSISLSYAYFSTSVKGNDNAKDVIVNAGTLSLTYTDSPEIIASNIKPGWSTTKVVSVKNTGTLDAAYNLIWQELTNEITDNEMLISATCERLNSTGIVEGTCDSVVSSSIGPDTIQRNISIESNITHKYTFTMTFKETNTNQNENQGKNFNGVIGIEEYKYIPFSDDTWSTIANNVKNGNTEQYNLGDTRIINMGDYGTHVLRVANKSTPSECNTTGFSQTACGFVIEFADIIIKKEMEGDTVFADSWPKSQVYDILNNDIYNNVFPTDLQNIIIDTATVSTNCNNNSTTSTTNDKLYLLSISEVSASFSSDDSIKSMTRQLDYYKNNSTIKKSGTEASSWWTRTGSCGDFMGFDIEGGTVFSSFGNISVGVSSAFRIG